MEFRRNQGKKYASRLDAFSRNKIPFDEKSDESGGSFRETVRVDSYGFFRGKERVDV